MTVVTASVVSTAKAYCPGHITGLLAKASDLTRYNKLKNEGKDRSSYLYKGSMGAGLAIDLGVTTTVGVSEKCDNYSGTTYDVFINGSSQSSDIEVTESVVEQYLELLRGKSYYIKIEHEISIPIGYGLSSSGAAALSLSYALNSALGVGLDIEQAAQIAHCSEIECKTGLGSILAQYVGGFELRSEIGAPGIGVVDKIPYLSHIQDLRVVILCLSPVSTKKFLTEHIEVLNGFGEKMLERLYISRNINDFLDMSFDFANQLGLIRGRSGTLIRRLKSQGFGCGVALFGDTIFSIVRSRDVNNVINCLKGNGGRLMVCGIDCHGARPLDK
jgi:pantoate kinase